MRLNGAVILLSLFSVLALLACQNTAFEANENFKPAAESVPPPTNGTLTLEATTNTTGAAISAFVFDSDGRVRGAIDSSVTATGVAVSTKFKTIDSNGCTTTVDAVLDNGSYTVFYLEDDGGGFTTFDKVWANCANETLLDAERGASNSVTVNGNTTITISNVQTTVTTAGFTLTVDRGATTPTTPDAECLMFSSAFANAGWTDRAHAIARVNSAGTFGGATSTTVQQNFRLPISNLTFFCWEDSNNPAGRDYEVGEKKDSEVLAYDNAQTPTINVIP